MNPATRSRPREHKVGWSLLAAGYAPVPPATALAILGLGPAWLFLLLFVAGVPFLLVGAVVVTRAYGKRRKWNSRVVWAGRLVMLPGLAAVPASLLAATPIGTIGVLLGAVNLMSAGAILAWVGGHEPAWELFPDV